MITSTSNQQIKQVMALIKKAKERKEKKSFVVEGRKMVAEAPRERIRAVYVSESYALERANALLLDGLAEDGKVYGYTIEIVSDAVMKNISDTQTPQGILAVVSMPEYDILDLMKGEETLVLILESIQDPGNLGTMVRTGEGAGVTGIIMNRTTVDLYNPKTIRSTMGSIYRVPYLITEDLPKVMEELQKAGVSLYAAHLKGKHTYDGEDYTKACGFLIGNEGNGLSDEISDCADAYIRIPMAGEVESLNAAISATLLMYEANRQRRQKVHKGDLG